MLKRVIIGCDHAGYNLKESIKAHLSAGDLEVVDKGAFSEQSVDYPDFAHDVAKSVSGDAEALGVLVCGSGNGVNITANKHQGIRAALAWTPAVAALAREHNNANVVSLPARFISSQDGLDIVDAFLTARFEGGRHERRVKKIDQVC
ncbi:MAG: ribose 5-phosphate isomerase B [Flavobacteriales bacterium]|nr:ribose 5-phosphate isomerase B [Flavobacteriales bacterium]